MSLALASGPDSMSRSPFVMPKAETPFSRANFVHDTTIGWRFVNPKMHADWVTESMPETAENVARARYGNAWGAGAAEACWHSARQYGLDRKQFGQPLAQTQRFEKKLPDMLTEISLGLQACYRVARLPEEGHMAHEAILVIKRKTVARRSISGACRATCMEATEFPPSSV